MNKPRKRDGGPDPEATILDLYLHEIGREGLLSDLGLLAAARKFDPDRGVKFIRSAVWWIRQAILSGLARQGRPVRVPLNRTADLARIVRASETLRQLRDRALRRLREGPAGRALASFAA